MSDTDRTPRLAPHGVGFGAIRSQLDEAVWMWGGNWGRLLFPAFWLVYLGAAIDHIARHQHGWPALAGYLIVGIFALAYLVTLPLGWGNHRLLFWPMFGLCVALTVAESFFARQDALVFCVYLAVLVISARSRYTRQLIVLLVAATALLPRFVPGWGHAIAWNQALTVFLVSIAMFGFFKIIQSNIELNAARAEVARLAAENERSRIARDLHDLLGHSLTTITVKAGLARRLAERGDGARATDEITEVELLGRQTLGQVRAAVTGYRDVTLAGELASAREVLRAAGIDVELPGAIDTVDAGAAEVFGWVVREGITNVVRHSRATRCTVTVGPRWIEIVDNGRSGASGAGNGLAGLSERLVAVGGRIEASGGPRGWRLRAEVGTAPIAAKQPSDAGVALP
ncbi:MAG: two-component system, NarL family, sensor histidine kinase DesK [Pseudonocardiales bacterium]|jgi:two-component system sensor histidine kinase DesK|nr:two-component system, NarL family, sensor histidine kinase DesK [Pseudonocardiales bacterium]